MYVYPGGFNKGVYDEELLRKLTTPISIPCDLVKSGCIRTRIQSSRKVLNSTFKYRNSSHVVSFHSSGTENCEYFVIFWSCIFENIFFTLHIKSPFYSRILYKPSRCSLQGIRSWNDSCIRNNTSILNGRKSDFDF